ncbi:MAG: polysaccharide deacetylase family protein [Lachnospiraceae bacterium]
MQIFFGKKWAVILGILAVMLIAIQEYGSTANASGDESVKVNGVVCQEKVVALTFDDGPGYKTTMQLLDGLKERGVHATFFLLGEKIEERQSVVERMHEDGHLIGNHTYSHVQLDAINLACAQAEVDKTNAIIEEITGEKPKYIRPPYGSWNDKLEGEIDMSAVMWTLDTSDWNTRDVRRIVDYVVDEVESGDIILMHDIYDTSVAAALEIVDQLQQRGYVFVTVDDLLID